ncbi:siderophore-interacting protein [Chitinophaga rhizophila]|uniref:Siderophore-interacting protein n=1 Tax=Chitinophaga rhizophila TaxID=2866212 RepID=A0ABS7G9T4_9BACT|nr:siderophore-interacting protein [Chitinophaga rhizophila]MBW8684409.1 siderophore-interacting protein [Chitinophaga rhizophila]
MSYLKDKAQAFFMARLGKTAHVINTAYITDHLLAVRLRLPDALKWRSCQHLKFEVAKLHYRDYTIASWNAAKLEATLLIDTGHEGAGSNWARQLQPGDTTLYAGPGGGFHQPTAASHLVCIGDASAIGHFSSLHQRKAAEQQFNALICHHQSLPATILDMPVHSILNDTTAVTEWLNQHKLPMGDVTFYVAGQIRLVVQTRKLLKQLGAKQVKPAGFWE